MAGFQHLLGSDVSVLVSLFKKDSGMTGEGHHPPDVLLTLNVQTFDVCHDTRKMEGADGLWKCYLRSRLLHWAAFRAGGTLRQPTQRVRENL